MDSLRLGVVAFELGDAHQSVIAIADSGELARVPPSFRARLLATAYADSEAEWVASEISRVCEGRAIGILGVGKGRHFTMLVVRHLIADDVDVRVMATLDGTVTPDSDMPMSIGHLHVRRDSIPEALEDVAGFLRDRAENMHRSRELRYRPAATLARNGGGEMVLCIPGAGDSITSFMDVATDLGRSYHVVGLQPRGIEGTLVPHASVERAAVFYADAVFEITRGVRVHVMGHSFGGWIAVELARALACRHVDVCSLVLLDSAPPTSRHIILDDGVAREAYAAIIEQRTGSGLRDRAALVAGSERDFIEGLHRHLVLAGRLHAKSSPAVLIGPFRTFVANIRTGYRPVAGYDGPSFLVQARSREAETCCPSVSQVDEWRSYLPGLKHWMSGGDHMSMLSGSDAVALCERLRGFWLTCQEISR